MKNHHVEISKLVLILLTASFASSCSNLNKGRTGAGSGQKKQFEKLDMNNDQRLSFDELGNAKKMKGATDPQRLFDQMDTNNDGYVSEIELKSSRKNSKKQR